MVKHKRIILIEKSIVFKVNGRTRAGEFGRIIICSYCKTERKVYHFSWSALMCGGCRGYVEKYDYLIK